MGTGSLRISVADCEYECGSRVSGNGWPDPPAGRIRSRLSTEDPKALLRTGGLGELWLRRSRCGPRNEVNEDTADAATDYAAGDRHLPFERRSTAVARGDRRATHGCATLSFHISKTPTDASPFLI